LPKTIKKRTKIVIPKKESKDYADYPTIFQPPHTRHTGHIRQWLVDNAKRNIVMLDDDLSFALRREDEPTKFVPPSRADILDMFLEIEDNLEVYKHIGVSFREGGHHNTEDHLNCTRMARVLAYHTKTVQKLKIRWDRCFGMDDFDSTLQLIEYGYPNLMINWMVQNQAGSQSQGGASEWRTKELQAKAAHRLKKFHPDYVKVVEKETKSGWFDGKRTDVIVQWKKAAKDAKP
jgi:hypothetical protein